MTMARGRNKKKILLILIILITNSLYRTLTPSKKSKELTPFFYLVL